MRVVACNTDPFPYFLLPRGVTEEKLECVAAELASFKPRNSYELARMSSE